MTTHTISFTVKPPTEEVIKIRELLGIQTDKLKKEHYEACINQVVNENLRLKKEIERLNLAIAEFSQLDSEVKINGQLAIPESTKVNFNEFVVQWKDTKLFIETVTKKIVIEPLAANRIVLL